MRSTPSVTIGGATALCPTCKGLLQSICNRGFERLRYQRLARLEKIRSAAEDWSAGQEENEDSGAAPAAAKTSDTITSGGGDVAATFSSATTAAENKPKKKILFNDGVMAQGGRKEQTAARGLNMGSTTLNDATLAAETSGGGTVAATPSHSGMERSPPPPPDEEEGRVSSDQVESLTDVVDKKKKKKRPKKNRLARHIALSQAAAVWQDFEAGAAARAAGPSAQNAQDDNTHDSTTPTLVQGAACGAASASLLAPVSGSVAATASIQGADRKHMAGLGAFEDQITQMLRLSLHATETLRNERVAVLLAGMQRYALHSHV